MTIDDELGAFSPQRGTVVTVGVFDGVHRGHKHLISHLIAQAKGKNLHSGVVTFREHPAATLDPSFTPQYLTTLDERLKRLKDTGVDFALPITFDNALSKLSAREFVALLKKHLRMVGIVVGPDFAMGRNREGTIDHLTELGREMNFFITVVDALRDKGAGTIRSTSIRTALLDGDVERVTDLLGRRFTLEGTVVSGERRGGPLGFPTANVEPPPGMAIPGDGVYATFAHLRDRRMMAATSIGTRPTFGEHERAIEAFILDFDGDLYGKDLRLEFVERLRDQVKYDTVEALQEQVDRDVEETKTALDEAVAPTTASVAISESPYLATLTCPECGFEEDLEMPTDYCQFFHECTNCKVVFRPKAGDDCVFCSYSDKLCPPKLLEADSSQ